MISAKIQKVQDELRRQHIDTLLVGNFGHQIADDLLYYLLLKKLELGVLFIPHTGTPVLYAITFEVRQLQKTYPELKVRPFDKKLSEILKVECENKVVGTRSNAMPTTIFNELKRIKNGKIKELENFSTFIAGKFSEEIKIMKKAAEVTGDVFELAIKNWKKFKTETDAANFINERFVALGYEPSFPTIVASGKNASHPHHVPKNAKLQKGFCVIDMGVRYNGYCSDMTRTIFIGKPTTQEQELYESVLFAQEATIERVRPGVPASGLDDYCRDLLGDELSNQFIHGLGHGVGTQVHEWPSVSGTSAATLEEHMIITIEPGVYKPNTYGIRIEDEIVVTKTKPIILTRTSKAFRTVK